MIKPFLKWPGGKRWAAPLIGRIIQERLGKNGSYYEPFLGGGAVFFYTLPPRAILGDVNRNLIEIYQTVRDMPVDVIKAIRRRKVSKESYYRIRNSKPRTAVGRAVRFLYLNRTGFAGMYRVNRAGKFNVPFGGGERTPEILWKTDLLISASVALKQATLLPVDFELMLKRAKRGDVVYCDPTYTVAHNNNCFVRYNERNFSWTDQERLVVVAENAARRGATVLVTNAHHSSIIRLYKGWKLTALRRSTVISPNVVKRHEITETLFMLPPR